MFTETEEYNGWPSWQHWNVALWLYNDYPTYTVCMEAIMNHPRIDEAAVAIIHYLPKATPDGAEYTLETVIDAIEDDHQEYWEIFEDNV